MSSKRINDKQIALEKLKLIINIVDQLSRQGLRTCDEIEEILEQTFLAIETYNPETQSIMVQR